MVQLRMKMRLGEGGAGGRIKVFYGGNLDAAGANYERSGGDPGKTNWW